ncbi:MAG: GlsB/YeaQ/YmgE family stress response membrane protein [Pseudomonadota bacterium]|nr:GlsB/YeaQ/YmgE family stress response membrane protein [Pseudomonadota bacterium]
MVFYILVWLVLGGLVGWIASIVMRTDAQQGILLNVAVGIAGAVIGALIFYRGDLQRPVTMESFVVALLGSILLLALINLFRRGTVR